MHESHARSVAKGLSWRFFATIDTVILAYLFTGSVSVAASIGGVEVITKIGWYYLHERAWLTLTPERVHPRLSRHFHHRSAVRSTLKTITWRAVGALDTTIISLALTGRLAISASIGGAELVTKVLLYFLHERLWLNVSWGSGLPQHEPHNLKSAIDEAKRELGEAGRALAYALLCVLFLLCMAVLTHALR